MLYKYRNILYAFLGLLFFMIFALVYATFDVGNSTEGENLKSINRIFSKGNGKIYATVPSGGDYEIKGADAASFRYFPDTYHDSHIGFDKNHVYAGNLILEGLNPTKVRPIGNNYYTDGVTTYYANSNSERNSHMSAFEYILKLIGYQFKLNDKPQDYWYAYEKMPDGKTYQAQSQYGIATTDNQVFYKGKLLPKANPKTLKPIYIKEKNAFDRESNTYFTDGEHVYYHTNLLDVKYDSSMYEIDIVADIPGRNTYLYDSKNGFVYADGIAFDKENAPYKLLTSDLKHAYQVFFTSKNGIYFYNSAKKKVERFGDNIFNYSDFKEIETGVFLSNNKIYYFDSEEVRVRNRGLDSRNTKLMELNRRPGFPFQKLQSKGLSDGSVWKSGDDYFFFDDMGSSQLMSSAVYKFKNPQAALNVINASSFRGDDIRELSRSELTEPDSKEIFIAETESGSNSDQNALFWILGISLGVGLLIVFIGKRMNPDPFIIEGDHLIATNLLFTKYRISEIDKVVFRVVGPAYRSPGYKGRFQIFKKNGDSSFNLLFSAKNAIMPESEATIRKFISQLQSSLDQKGIRNSVEN